MSFLVDPNQVVLDTDEDWNEPFDCYLDNQSTPDVLTGLLVEGALSVSTKGGSIVLPLSTNDGSILVTSNSFQPQVTGALLKSTFPAGGVADYSFVVTRSSGVKDGLVRGKRKIQIGIIP
jgi:hypothetical protein